MGREMEVGRVLGGSGEIEGRMRTFLGLLTSPENMSGRGVGKAKGGKGCERGDRVRAKVEKLIPGRTVGAPVIVKKGPRAIDPRATRLYQLAAGGAVEALFYILPASRRVTAAGLWSFSA